MEDVYRLSRIRGISLIQSRISLSALVSEGIARVFSCRHREMGVPVTLGGRTYRACLECGLKRDFDPRTWTMHGPYYRS